MDDFEATAPHRPRHIQQSRSDVRFLAVPFKARIAMAILMCRNATPEKGRVPPPVNHRWRNENARDWHPVVHLRQRNAHPLPEGAWKSKPVVKACPQAGNHRITRATEEASRRARRNGRQNEKLLPHSVDPGRLASRFGKAVRPSVDPHGAAPWVYHPKLHQPQRGVANLTGRQLSE